VGFSAERMKHVTIIVYPRIGAFSTLQVIENEYYIGAFICRGVSENSHRGVYTTVKSAVTIEWVNRRRRW